MSRFVSTTICGVFEAAAKAPSRPVVETDRPIRGRYDAAGDSPETRNIWVNADQNDADASNSLGVRKRLRERSRYEQANNGYADGMVSTHANYVIGRGPKLRMETGSSAFNAMVEAKWIAWCKATGFARKLRTLQRAKTGDGEGVGVLKTNPNIRDAVKIDLQLIECDQMTTPFMPWGVPGKIDGLTFDDFGNIVDYQILKYHPGGLIWNPILDPDDYPEKFVVHLFDRKRPGQHRGAPAFSSTLNLSATSRRYREAEVAAAENAANFSVIVAMGAPSDGPDEVRPFTTVPVEKRMMIMSPAGGVPYQMKAEHPAANYEGFIQTQVAEQGRPISMSRNIAACDSSDYSFSGGQLDHLTYFVGVDVEQQDGEEDVLDKVFALWFAEAVYIYGWNVDAQSSPKHSWSWPARPKIDEEKTANARKTSLGSGQITLGRIYEEDGYDFEEELVVMAKNYGVSTAQMRMILLCQNFSDAVKAIPSMFQAIAESVGVVEKPPSASTSSIDQKTAVPEQRNGTNRFGRTNREPAFS